ncbi:MAG: hypothetical protein RIT45_3278 [Pseudomonadota bacterium]
MSPNREQSAAWYARSCAVTPGGVHSPVRAFKSVGGSPVYFARGEGARVWDVDGNSFLDFQMSWGPLILGHADPDVVAAVRDTAPAGLSYGATHRLEVELAELVVSAFPHMEMCRFVNSGTEAVMTALRLARGATGRSSILKFSGGYHGHIDSLLVRAGSGLVTAAEGDAEPTSAGIPHDVAATTLVAPLGDLDAVRGVFAAHGDHIAAVIVEPMPANNGLLLQTDAWLRGLRALCDQHGALLIFDEVISGFRLQFGGYGDLHGVRADLITLGKVIGGGMPVGAVVAPRALLELLAPIGPVYQAGTLSGNPVSMAAGLATLRKLQDPAVYAHLEALGARFETRLCDRGVREPIVIRQGSIVWPYFDADAPAPDAAEKVSDRHVARFNALHRPLLDAGFFLPPSAYEVLFLSAAHTEADVDALVDAIVELDAAQAG